MLKWWPQDPCDSLFLPVQVTGHFVQASQQLSPLKIRGICRREDKSEMTVEEHKALKASLASLPQPSPRDRSPMQHSLVQALFHVPDPVQDALVPTSRVLRPQHLMPLLERVFAPGRLLPHTPVLAAQAVRARTS